MLNSHQATTIVKRCIRKVSGQNSKVQDKLKSVGIKTSNQIQSLITLIVSDAKVGVKSKGHSLNANCLNGITPANTVASVRRVVKDNAVEV